VDQQPSQIKRHLFKAETPEQGVLWIKCLNKYTNNLDQLIEEDLSTKVGQKEEKPKAQARPRKQRKQAAPTKEDMVEEQVDSFYQRLYVDDCDFNEKIETINAMLEMHREEAEQLDTIIETSQDEMVAK